MLVSARSWIAGRFLYTEARLFRCWHCFLERKPPPEHAVINGPFLERQARRALDEYVAAHGSALEKQKRDELIAIAIRLERQASKQTPS